MSNPDTERVSEKEEDSYFSTYEAHSKTLRNWLILYGAAIPAFFLKEETFAGLLKESGQGQMIIALFLLGILLQVAQVFLYKIAMGYIYLGEVKKEFVATNRYEISSWYSEQTWPVIVSDLGSIIVYGWASWMLMTAFLIAKPPAKDANLNAPTVEIQTKSAEQVGTGQPATRPESKAEGSDKPQPEAEGSFR
jgi:hypothetical protein